MSLDAVTAATYDRCGAWTPFGKVVGNVSGLAASASRDGAPARVPPAHVNIDDRRARAAACGSAPRREPPAAGLQRPRPHGGQSLHGRLVGAKALIQHAAVAAGPPGSSSASGRWRPRPQPGPGGLALERLPPSLGLVYDRARNVLPCCIAPWITAHYDGIVSAIFPPAARGDLVGPALESGTPSGEVPRAVPRLWREMEPAARPPAVYSDRARPGVPLRGMSARAWG